MVSGVERRERFLMPALPVILIAGVLLTGCHPSASGPAGNQSVAGAGQSISSDTRTPFGTVGQLTDTTIPPEAVPNVKAALKYVNDMAAGNNSALLLDQDAVGTPSWSEGAQYFAIFQKHNPVSSITVDAFRKDPDGDGGDSSPFTGRVFTTVTFADKRQAEFTIAELWKTRKGPWVESCQGGLLPAGYKKKPHQVYL